MFNNKIHKIYLPQCEYVTNLNIIGSRIVEATGQSRVSQATGQSRVQHKHSKECVKCVNWHFIINNNDINIKFWFYNIYTHKQYLLYENKKLKNRFHEKSKKKATMHFKKKNKNRIITKWNNANIIKILPSFEVNIFNDNMILYTAKISNSIIHYIINQYHLNKCLNYSLSNIIDELNKRNIKKKETNMLLLLHKITNLPTCIIQIIINYFNEIEYPETYGFQKLGRR
jgi:hypothetical protein